MTISEFNKGGDFSSDLLEEFGNSGNLLADGIWNKPAANIKQRQATAINLFETLLASSPESLGARFHSVIRRLPLLWRVHSLLYGHRTMRGDASLWADTVATLLVRMPLATTLYDSERYGRARVVIQECLRALMFSSHVDGLDYERNLAPRMLEILDVAKWYANNHPNAKADVGLIIVPIAGFLYNYHKIGKLSGTAKDEFQNFYDFLDKNINVHTEQNSSWSSLHKYLFDALGEERGESKLLGHSEDIAELIRDFTENLSRLVGAELAENLISDDSKKTGNILKSLAPDERASTLLLLLKARELWAGTVGIDYATTYGVLHRELNSFSCWRNLNDTIRRLADQQMEVSDQQMAELVDSLAGAGNIIAEVTVERALTYCKMGGYPKTLQALKTLPVTGEMAVTPFFDETLKLARRGLLRV